MARATMLLVLAGCLMMASVCLVQAERSEHIRFVFYQRHGQSNELQVFGPRDRDSRSDSDRSRGRGFVYTDIATKSEDSKSERFAEVSGLYFYINENQFEKISTIYFEDVDVNQDKRFANAQLHLRGVWNEDRNGGREWRRQEIAVIGGTRGLAGARGVVRYERIQGEDLYKVIGRIQIDRESEATF